MNMKKVIWLEVLGFVVFFVLFSILDFYPRLRTAQEIREKIRAAEESLKAITQGDIAKRKEDLEAQLNRVRDELEIMRKGVAEIQNKAMKTKNIALMTQEILKVASSCNIELTSIRPLTAQAKADYEVLPVEMELQCSYAELIKFLSAAESSSALAYIQRLNVYRDNAIYPKLAITLTACVIFSKS